LQSFLKFWQNEPNRSDFCKPSGNLVPNPWTRPYQHNNGRVFVSQRTASQEIGSSYAEIARWFRELQYYGFFRRRAEASASTARALHRTGD
jgi:hypothetical protein